MEGVRSAVRCQKAFTGVYCFQESLFTLLRHRWMVVAAGGGQVARGIEQERVVSAQVAVENAAVLGGHDVKPVLLAKLGDHALVMGKLIAFAFAARMFEALTAREHEQLAFLLVCGADPTERERKAH